MVADNFSTFESFAAFMYKCVLPRKLANPAHMRLDGQSSGSSVVVFGRFNHEGRIWEVHEDTRYGPLMLAYAALELKFSPFVEEPTNTGKRRRLSLSNKLREAQGSRSSYLYIYSSL
jgi:hypothetical protein